MHHACKYPGNMPDGKLFSKAGQTSSMRKIHFPKKHKTVKKSLYNISPLTNKIIEDLKFFLNVFL